MWSRYMPKFSPGIALAPATMALSPPPKTTAYNVSTASWSSFCRATNQDLDPNPARRTISIHLLRLFVLRSHAPPGSATAAIQLRRQHVRWIPFPALPRPLSSSQTRSCHTTHIVEVAHTQPVALILVFEFRIVPLRLPRSLHFG